MLAAAGTLPVAPDAGAEYYARTWAEASLDVNGVMGGDAVQPRTIVPAIVASAMKHVQPVDEAVLAKF